VLTLHSIPTSFLFQLLILPEIIGGVIIFVGRPTLHALFPAVPVKPLPQMGIDHEDERPDRPRFEPGSR
jgi:hypothetical protein